jgi:hypothetical protein
VLKIKLPRKRVQCESLGCRAHNLLDSWIKQLESNIRNYIARLWSDRDIPGVQCQKLKNSDIELAGSMDESVTTIHHNKRCHNVAETQSPHSEQSICSTRPHPVKADHQFLWLIDACQCIRFGRSSRSSQCIRSTMWSDAMYLGVVPPSTFC